MNVLVISLALLGFGHLVSCSITSGTFYKKVSEDGNNVKVSTESFHPCSFKNDCKYVGISIGDGDDKVYSTSTMQELQLTKNKMQVWEKVEQEEPKAKEFKSCKDAKKKGVSKNGIVQLVLGKNIKKKVFCDMVKDEGGWIVFQKRVNKNVNFERNWQAYEDGFGNLNGNFWLGLKTIHNLTSNGNWTLRVDLKLIDGEKGHAKYTDFKIGNPKEKYRISLNKFAGDIGDALQYHKGMPFSTFDSDNDEDNALNCASAKKGGWWYKFCYQAMLNNYYPGTGSNKGSMMSWETWKGTNADIIFSEMKMKEEI